MVEKQLYRYHEDARDALEAFYGPNLDLDHFCGYSIPPGSDIEVVALWTPETEDGLYSSNYMTYAKLSTKPIPIIRGNGGAVSQPDVEVFNSNVCAGFWVPCLDPVTKAPLLEKVK